MTDIHSIGQVFKIVSERTAKRKTSKLITDGDSTIRRSITSQEFPPQKDNNKGLYIFKPRDLEDYRNKVEKQARADTIRNAIRKIKQKMIVVQEADLDGKTIDFRAGLFEAKSILEQLGEGEKK